MRLCLFSIVVLALVNAGCSTAPKPRAAEQPTVQKTQPGASAWESVVHLLPEGAPHVATLRIEQIFRGLNDFKGWLEEDPESLGALGAEVSARLNFYWDMATAYLGAVPTDPVGWSQRGLDVQRPMYVATHPVAEKDARSYVESAIALVGEEISADGAGMVDALEKRIRDGRVPVGMNARLTQALGNSPAQGRVLRIVLPTSDSQELVSFLMKVVDLGEYVELDSAAVAERNFAPETRVFSNPDGLFDSFAFSVHSEHLVFDGIFENLYDPESDRDPLAAATRAPVGIPAAPKHDGEAAVSLGFDLSAVGWSVAAEDLRNALSLLDQVEMARRDEIAARGLREALVNQQAWSTRADELTGLTYALEAGGGTPSSPALRLSMDIVGKPLASADDAAGSSPVGALDSADRSAFASMGTALLFDRGWVEWLRMEDPWRPLQVLDSEGSDRVFHLFSVPRSLTLLLVNLLSHDPGFFGSEYRLLHAHAHGAQRIEMALLDASLADFGRSPRFLIHAPLKPDASASLRQNTASALVNFAAMLVDYARGAPSEQGPVAAITPGETQIVEHGDVQIRYRYSAQTDVPSVLVGVGVDTETFDRELSALTEPKPERSYGIEGADMLGFFRIEPVTLISVLSDVEDLEIDPQDLPPITQRLGAFLMRVSSSSDTDVQRLKLSIEVGRPASL